MATINGLTAERMLEIEAQSIVDGDVVSDNLILTRHDGTTINAGNVRGAPGSAGPAGTGPTGSIAMFAGTAAPTGHLLCDGSAVSRSTYAALFTVIGTVYGVGDNSTTFNLPNLKGRVSVGRDSTQTEFDTLGETGGSKTHTLSAAEMPSHSHVQNAHSHTSPAHNHTQTGHDHVQNAHNHAPGTLSGYMTYGATTVGRTRVATGTTSDRIAITTTNTNDLGITLTATSDATQNSVTATAVNQTASATVDPTTPTAQTTGGGGSHNNLQPYVVLNYIIKT